MEIMAVLEAVRALDGPLEVVSDSTYVINCFRDHWWEAWLQNNWSNRQRNPVANRDLWEPLVEMVRHRDIRFRWVRGHSGDPINDLVDQLAVRACRTQQGQQGDVPDAEIATTDADRSLHAPQEPCPSAGDHDGGVQ